MQFAIPAGAGSLLQYGVLGVMLVFVVVMWDRDAAARRQVQKESDERYTTLVGEVLKIVQSNTAAQTGLVASIGALVEALSRRPCLREEAGTLTRHIPG